MLTAWLGAISIGLTLGLLGSGGAIITVPLLVYLIGHPEKQAIAESLAIVGGVALAGAVRAQLRGKLSWPHVLLLGLPGMAGAYAGARLARHISGAVQLIALGVIMLGVAVLMFRGTVAENTGAAHRRINPVAPIIQGLGLGVLTGLLGVGGGFLIVPTLVLLAGLPMQTAVGTSLAIIALNCASGFVKAQAELARLPEGGAIDAHTTLVFMGLGVAGTLIGGSIGARINQARLRKVFAVFLLAMAGYILWRESPRLGQHPPPAASGPSQPSGDH